MDYYEVWFSSSTFKAEFPPLNYTRYYPFDCEDTIDKNIQFKCVKCKNIVSLDDKFNDDLKEDQMCKLCTMFAAYDD